MYVDLNKLGWFKFIFDEVKLTLHKNVNKKVYVVMNMYKVKECECGVKSRNG